MLGGAKLPDTMRTEVQLKYLSRAHVGATKAYMFTQATPASTG